MTLTTLVFNPDPKDKEVEEDTTAVISCVVSGITEAVTVSWTDSADGALTDGSDYTITDGTYDGSSNSQTTTLNVTAGVAVDSTFSCVVNSTEWNITEDVTEVALNVFALTLDDRSVSTATDQTITCAISGLSATASVSWKDPDGTTISSDANYTVDVGTLNGSEEQTSTLTINTTKLADLDTESNFTCEVTSGEFTDSATSSNIMTLTKLFWGVERISKEVKANAEATLSCIVSGLTQDLDSVSWTDSSDAVLTSNASYVIKNGSYEEDSNSQTTTLTVTAGVEGDSTFSCVVTSEEWDLTENKTEVALNVFDMHIQGKEVESGSAVNVTCVVSGLSQDIDPADVTWTVAGVNYTSSSSSTDYTVLDGELVNGSISSTITVESLTEDLIFTCNVEVAVGVFTEQEEILVFGLHAHDDVVLSGEEKTISCWVRGLDSNLTTDDVTWWTSDANGTEVELDATEYGITWTQTPTENDTTTYNGETNLTIPALETATDTNYTCKVEVHSKTYEDVVSVDVFEIREVGDVVPSDTSTKSRVLIEGLQSDQDVSIAWYLDDILVTESDLHTYNDMYPDDGIQVMVTEDTTYNCTVSVAVKRSATVKRSFPNNIFIDHVEVTHANVIEESRDAAELVCTVNNVESSLSSSSWSLNNSDDFNSTEDALSGSSQAVRYSTDAVAVTDEGEWTCQMEYLLGTDNGTEIMRVISNTLYLDVPEFTTALVNEYVTTGESATFTCEARVTEQAQNFAPTYSWTVAEEDKTGEDGTELIISSGTDNSTVVCTATYNDTASFVITSSAKLFIQDIRIEPAASMYAVKGEEINITCTYTSAHASNSTPSWNKDGDVISDGGSYTIANVTSNDNIITTLTILDTTTSHIKSAVFACVFESASTSNNLTATIEDVFEISSQTSSKVKVLSGYSAAFTVTVNSTDDFDVTYEWYLNDETTALDTTSDSQIDNQTQSVYTTDPLMFADDTDNKYSCKVTWTGTGDQEQVLWTISQKAGVEITDSCYIDAEENEQTSRDPEEDYVEDDTPITTTCEEGYILPIGTDTYAQTCDIENHATVTHDITITNCIEGCAINAVFNNSDGDNAAWELSDDENLNATDLSYTTIHVGTSATIICDTGYVQTSDATTVTKTCESGGTLQFDTCKKGCPLTASANATYTDVDDNDLIAPGTSMEYTCVEDTVNKDGGGDVTSATCAEDGGDVPLNKCFRPVFATAPATVVGSSYVTITITKPVFPSTLTSETLADPASYTCTVKDGEGTTKGTADVDYSSTAECVINELESNTTYTYTVLAIWSTESLLPSPQQDTEYSFSTSTPVPSTDDDTVTLEVPATDYDFDTYDVVAYWYGEGSSEDSNFKFAASRRKRATTIEEDDIYESYEKLKDSGATSGAFYAIKGKPYDEDSVTLTMDDLGLASGQTFAVLVLVCNPDDSSDCVMGVGSVVELAKDLTVTIVLAVLFTLIIVVLGVGAAVLYLRQDKFPWIFNREDTSTVIGPNGKRLTGDIEPGPLDPPTQMTGMEPRIPDPIRVADFLGKYRKLMQDTEYLLDREYDEIKKEVPAGEFSYHFSKLPENKIKNRYVDIIPYDESRVKLQPSASHPSDYVNACHVTNMSDQREFIAAQGPKEETINDFWQMIWENRSLSIVMVTNLVEKGRKKCAQYWSDESTVTYGDVTVTVDGSLTFPDYCIRTMTVERGSEKRSVFHFHYLIWPDHGAPPTTSLIDFCRRCFSECVDGPVVVHCSAGVGRTGTLIALHLQMRMLAENQLVNLFGIVCRLRRCRKLMVQTSVQYKFLYQAVREMIICDDTFIAARDFNAELTRLSAPKSGNQYMTLLDEQFRRLEEYCTIHITHDKPEFKTTSGSQGVNHNKNRYSNVLPYDVNRVKLRAIATSDSGSDYINASFINSYHERDAFVATQGPKQNTIGDFWRMIWEKDVTTIVMLTPLVDRGREKCTMYWPNDKDDPISVENITVHLLNSASPDPHYTVRTFSISMKNHEEDTTRQVKQYHYFKWTDQDTPKSGKHLIKMIDQVKNQRKAGPMVVHCSAGIGRTAVFMAIYNCIEQLRQDEMIDLFTIVLRLRLQRNGMIQSVDQYAFCYRVIAEVCNLFDDYINA